MRLLAIDELIEKRKTRSLVHGHIADARTNATRTAVATTATDDEIPRRAYDAAVHVEQPRSHPNTSWVSLIDKQSRPLRKRRSNAYRRA